MKETDDLNTLRDHALRIAVEHGFTEASVPEDVALMHSELSELLEDYRAGKLPTDLWYEAKDGRAFPSLEAAFEAGFTRPKPCGIPSEVADVIIRALHFCGKHKIDIGKAVTEKMDYNESRPYMNGGKKI